jgi:gluconolactonase
VSDLELIASGLRFPEGPVCLADGSVLVVELESGTLARVDPRDGTVERIAQCGGAPNGAAIGPDGAVYIANNGGFRWDTVDGHLSPSGISDDYSGGRIQRVDLETGAAEDVVVEVEGRPLRGPNDLVFDARGGFYFTDLGKSFNHKLDTGFVYYVEPGLTIARPVATDMLHPNGVGLSPTGERLYVAESHTGRIWWWDIAQDGSLAEGSTPFGSGRGNLLRGFGGYQLLDSMAIEVDGNICQATVLDSGVAVVSDVGELVDFIANDEDLMTTNICFGGEDLRTAYITSSGKGLLLTMSWPRAGLRLNFAPA